MYVYVKSVLENCNVYINIYIHVYVRYIREKWNRRGENGEEKKKVEGKEITICDPRNPIKRGSRKSAVKCFKMYSAEAGGRPGLSSSSKVRRCPTGSPPLPLPNKNKHSTRYTRPRRWGDIKRGRKNLGKLHLTSAHRLLVPRPLLWKFYARPIPEQKPLHHFYIKLWWPRERRTI